MIHQQSQADPPTSAAGDHDRSPALKVSDVAKRYGDVEAVRGVSFEIAPREIVCVCGPNGAGKTTLLEIVQGSRLADRGEVSFLGRRAARGSRARDDVGVLFQDGGAPDKCKVGELLGVFQSLYPGAMEVAEALAAVGMEDKEGSEFRALSGGQRRRVLVATALVGRPPVLLLDEPTSGLDPQSREQVWDAIGAAARAGSAVLVTTHYLDEAEDYCDRVLLLSQGDVVAQGPARDVLESRDLRHCCVLSAEHAEEVRALDSFAAATASRRGGARFFVFFGDDDSLATFADDVRSALGPAGEVQIRRSRLEDLLLLAGDEAATELDAERGER